MLSVDWTPAVVAVFGLPACGYVGVRTWRGWEGHDPDGMAEVWGANHAKALMRAMPCIAVAGGLLILSVLALAYQSSGLLGGVLVVACVCSVVIAGSLILTNRPRRLIPPKFRDERSLIATWWRS